MAEVLQPYSLERFNALPTLYEARMRFTNKGGVKFVHDIIQPLVEKHDLTDKVGAGLLHRHFDLRGKEKLVEFNNIATAWTNTTGDEYFGGKVLPCAWLILDGKLMPYEYYFSPGGTEDAMDFTNMQAFIREFISLVKESGMEQTIALRRFPGKGFKGSLEITEGRANINLLPGQYPENSLEKSTEAMWFFQPQYLAAKCFCACYLYMGEGHQHGHGNN